MQVDNVETQAFDIYGPSDDQTLPEDLGEIEGGHCRERICRCKTLLLGDPTPQERCQACLEADAEAKVERGSHKPAAQASAPEAEAVVEVQVQEELQGESRNEDRVEDCSEDCGKGTGSEAVKDVPEEPTEEVTDPEPKVENNIPQAPIEDDAAVKQPEAVCTEPQAETVAPRGATATHAQPAQGHAMSAALRFRKSGLSEKEFQRRLTYVRSKTAKLESKSPSQKANKQPEEKPHEQKPRDLQKPADPLDEAAARSAEAAEKDALDAIASGEEKPEGPIVKANKLLKVNGYQLPPGWGAYISPEDQKVADGSAPKKRGRKPKAKAEPGPSRKRESTEEPAERPTKRRKAKNSKADQPAEIEHEVEHEVPKRKRKAAAEVPQPSEPEPKRGSRKRKAKEIEEQLPAGSGKSEANTAKPKARAKAKAKAKASASKPEAELEEVAVDASKLRSRKCVAYARAKKEMIKQGFDPKDPRVAEAGKKATR